MRVPVWVDLGSKEIEVEISSEDIVNSFIASDEGMSSLLPRTLNNIAGFMNKLPDEELRCLSPSARKLVIEFLEKQALRMKETA